MSEPRLLPKGWSVIRGKDAFSFITSGSRGWAQYYADSGPLFIRVGNFNRSSVSLDWSDRQCVRPPLGAEGLRTRTMTGDVLITIMTAKGRIERYAPATAQKNINLDILEKVAVPLPPAVEQERIVAEVDRHLSRADALAASIAQSKRRAQRLRRAILAAAFQGRLVPQDPNDEPASVLLDRIRAQAATAEAATAATPRRGRPPAPARAAEPVAAYDAPAPKRRGRPPGSKNKAKA